MTGRTDAALAAARELLSSCDTVAAFSGAGLSAESGLSTFRDPDADALWSRFDPTELASPQGFQANPERVIDWYNWRRAKLAAAEPNPAHRALAAQAGMIQVTQNVDNLLEQAGADPHNVYHLHGNLLQDCCHNPDCDRIENVDLSEPQPLRRCPDCGDYLRPAVVWFGESLPESTWGKAQALCVTVDCLLVIGTSATVYPAAGLVELARRGGSRIIVVDPNPYGADGGADLHIAAPAGEAVPRLLQDMQLTSIRA